MRCSLRQARAFDEKIDYYQRLSLDEFASAADIKKAYMKRSLLLHPDKQVGKPEEEVEAAVSKFKELTEAYEILGDMATRRQYDRERDKRNVSATHFGHTSSNEEVVLPPCCVDVEIELELLFSGGRKSVVFARRAYDAFVRETRTVDQKYTLKIDRGMLDGSTFWYKGEGHRERLQGPTNLVFVLKQKAHPTFEREALATSLKSPLPLLRCPT